MCYCLKGLYLLEQQWPLPSQGIRIVVGLKLYSGYKHTFLFPLEKKRFPTDVWNASRV